MNRVKQQYILSLMLFVAYVFISVSVQAEEAEPVGIIISQNAPVTVRAADGSVRQVTRRSKIYPGDVIVTPAGTSAQVRFNNIGLVSVQPGTALSIETEQTAGIANVFFRLEQGGVQVRTSSNNNQQALRIETPVGSLSSQSGHISATYCASECRGQPAGLYGGVAQGKVEVCNAGGCNSFGRDDYFYTANKQTASKTLIAPPVLVFASANTFQQVAQTSSNTTTQTIFFDNTINTDVVIQCSNESGSSNPCDPNAETPDGVISLVEAQTGTIPIATTDPISTPTLPITVLAAFAVVTDKATNPTISDLVSPGDAGVTINQNASDVITGVIQGSGADTTEVDFNSSTPVLNNSTTYTKADDDISASLGRWTGTVNISESGNASTASDFHFVTTADIANSLPGTASTTLVTYSLTNGAATPPTDGNGNTGTLDILDMDFNFMSQELASVDLQASFSDGRLYSAGLLGGAVSLTGVATKNISLSGNCIGGGCGGGDPLNGSTSFSFLGDNASALAGSYGLNTSSDASSIAGAYVLNGFQVPSSVPADSVTLNSAILDAGTGTQLQSSIVGTGKNAISFSGAASASSVGVITHDNGMGTLTENAVVQSIVSSDMTNFDAIGEDLSPPQSFNCTNCLDVNLIPGPTDLSDAVKHVGANYTAYWARWSDQQVAFNLGSGDENYNAADMFYAYSEDLRSDGSATASGGSTISYSKVSGSNPIDQDGVSGTLGAVTMDINFDSQQITVFNMNLTTADGDWDAHLPYVTGTTIQDPVALSGAVNSFAVEGLASDSTGGITAAGTSNRYDIFGDVNTALLGANAGAVLGSYNLSVVDTLGAPQDAEAIGTFLLERPQNVFNTSADVLSTSASGSIGLGAVIFNAGGGPIPGFVAASGVDQNGVGLTNVAANQNAVVSGDFVGDSEFLDTTDSTLSINIKNATLADYNNTSSLSVPYVAYWGRWHSTTDNVTLDGTSTFAIEGSQHFAYSNDLTETLPTSGTVTYSKFSGTSPTTEQGFAGTLNSVNMVVDFGSQNITDFDILVSAGGNTWDASMVDAAVPLANSAVHNFALQGSVNAGAHAVEGNANTALLGPNADAVLGAYNLDAQTINESVVGSFLLRP